MAIPATFLQELIARADIVEIVGRYVQLKKGGANFMGLCPFHAEKSPSFTVSPTKQFYHCFGCGEHGDAIGFLMKQTGASFREAVQDLAGQYGLQVPDDDASPQDKALAAARREKQATLTDVLEQAGAAYRKHLKASPRAIDYLKGRGLSGEIAKHFGLGYAPEGWNSLASVFANYADPLLVESGLVIQSEEDENKRYDRFRDRIMFPIRNIKGECIGFGGRVLGDEKPKYLNSPETPVFSKGLELYGLFEAQQAIRKHGYALVTEGYMDVVALAQLGFANAVATLGTACTPEHVKKLFRFTDSVVFSFDGDAAGRTASRRALDAALPFATDTRTIKFLFLPTEPKKHDPDSYIREFGPEAFARQVTEAAPLSRFLIDAAREGCDLSSAEGRAKFSHEAYPLWNALQEGVLKRQLIKEIADFAQLDARELQGLWDDANRRNGKHAEPARQHGRSTQRFTPSHNRRPLDVPNHIAEQPIRLLLTHSDLWEQLSLEDHELLCALPERYGELLAWLESHLQDHGPQPWAALRLAWRDKAVQDPTLQKQVTQNPALIEQAPLNNSVTWVEKLMLSDLAPTDDRAEAEQELRNLLKPLHIEQLKAKETEAIAAAQTDPTALERYRELHARRLALSS